MRSTVLYWMVFFSSAILTGKLILPPLKSKRKKYQYGKKT
jgi:hypothetical protein